MTAPPPTRFKTAVAFRAWLRKHHRTASELVLRIAKVHASASGVTYAQALDEALCYGWIDGIRRALDADSFTVRFTPRKPRSIWSQVNVRHARRLIREGRMTKAGLAAFAAREEDRTGVYSFERKSADLPSAYRRRFAADKDAWAWFQQEAPWYRRTCTHWVMSAKREDTRLRRLDALITCSAQQTRIGPLNREAPPSPRRTASRPRD